jgi:hypothetical protein
MPIRDHIIYYNYYVYGGLRSSNQDQLGKSEKKQMKVVK